MRITHIISSMDPKQGGPPVVVANLAQAQAELGHTISIGCEHPAANSAFAVFQLPTIRFPFPTSRCSLPDTDVVHMHGVWEPVLPCVARESRKRGIPYLVAPHGMLDPWSLQQRRWKKQLALLFGYRRMLNRASALHVLNVDEGRLIEPLRIDAPRVVIPNGISPADLEQVPDPARFRAHPNGPGNAPYILFLSRLHYKKGLDYLADAFAVIAKQHPESVLAVVGPDGGAEAAFRNQIEKLGLTSRLRMPGPLFGADKWSAITAQACSACRAAKRDSAWRYLRPWPAAFPSWSPIAVISRRSLRSALATLCPWIRARWRMLSAQFCLIHSGQGRWARPAES